MCEFTKYAWFGLLGKPELTVTGFLTMFFFYHFSGPQKNPDTVISEIPHTSDWTYSLHLICSCKNLYWSQYILADTGGRLMDDYLTGLKDHVWHSKHLRLDISTPFYLFFLFVLTKYAWFGVLGKTEVVVSGFLTVFFLSFFGTTKNPDTVTSEIPHTSDWTYSPHFIPSCKHLYWSHHILVTTGGGVWTRLPNRSDIPRITSARMDLVSLMRRWRTYVATNSHTFRQRPRFQSRDLGLWWCPLLAPKRCAQETLRYLDFTFLACVQS